MHDEAFICHQGYSQEHAASFPIRSLRQRAHTAAAELSHTLLWKQELSDNVPTFNGFHVHPIRISKHFAQHQQTSMDKDTLYMHVKDSKWCSHTLKWAWMHPRVVHTDSHKHFTSSSLMWKPESLNEHDDVGGCFWNSALRPYPSPQFLTSLSTSLFPSPNLFLLPPRSPPLSASRSSCGNSVLIAFFVARFHRGKAERARESDGDGKRWYI